MTIPEPSFPSGWHLLTRLGEAQILLPAAAIAALVLLRCPRSRPLGVWWLALVAAAAFVTTATKVAFIGWGIGSPEFNFTGISGHAMFAAAIYPLLLGTLAVGVWPESRWVGVALGSALAVLVGVSRVVVGVHSGSEVFGGLLLGASASAIALAMAHLPPVSIGPAFPAAVLLWLGVMPAHAPVSNTHSAVVQLALFLSGHNRPFTREEMLRGLWRQKPAHQLPRFAPIGTT